jgi:hypothetical protein
MTILFHRSCHAVQNGWTDFNRHPEGMQMHLRRRWVGNIKMDLKDMGCEKDGERCN